MAKQLKTALKTIKQPSRNKKMAKNGILLHPQKSEKPPRTDI
jgi:hypothetical protein